MEINPFWIFPALALLAIGVFVLAIGGILLSILSGIAGWISNNAQPVLSLEARVVAKRVDVGGRMVSHSRGRTWTNYYATFEVPDGMRHEFRLSGGEYGQFVERDTGVLTFQGSRYRGFRRHVGKPELPLDF